MKNWMSKIIFQFFQEDIRGNIEVENKLFEKKQNNKKIVAKCGFITGDPDIDAVTRLFWPVNVKNVKSKQNYYFSWFFHSIQWSKYFNFKRLCNVVLQTFIGRKKFRYLDKLSNLWIAEIYGEIVCYGTPVLKQIRNKHDYWKDYDLEVEHNISTDYFADMINKVKVKKQIDILRIKKYVKCYWKSHQD